MTLVCKEFKCYFLKLNHPVDMIWIHLSYLVIINEIMEFEKT